MKILLLIFSSLFSPIVTFAQQTVPTGFVEQNKEWNVRWRMITGAPYDYSHLYSLNYYISGDTIINGKDYCKMYCNDQYRGKKRQYVLALYEDAGKMFFIPRGKDEEHLLYDFSAQVGDWVRARGFSTTWGGSDFEFLVWKREEKEFQGKKRRCLLVVPKNAKYSIPEDADDKWAEGEGEWWIEGIGTEKSPIEHYLPDFAGSVHYLEYCKDGKGLLYQRDYTPPICLVEENMSWIVEYADADREPEDTRVEKLHYFFDPHSRGELDGFFSRLLSVSVLGDEKNAHIVADMREEDGKVYICPWKRAPLSFLLYDFSANVGDEMEITGVPALNRYEDYETIPELYSAKCRVEKVEEVEIEGLRRRRLYVQVVLPYEDFKDSPTYDDVWLEGIGSVRGILGNVSFEMDGKSPYTKLQECSWSGEVYYQADESLWPAYIHPITTARHNDGTEGVMYDLSGRQLKSPSKGIHIIRYSDGTAKKVYTR